MLLWLGGWGAAMDSAAEGIGVLAAGEADAGTAGGPLGFVGTAARAESPSWLAAHPVRDVVYAALESEGRVQAFRRTDEASLAPLGRPVEVGEAVCHVAVSPDAGFLVATCWGDGRVVRVALSPEGAPGDIAAAAAATDPHAPERADRADAAASTGPADIDLRAAVRALREAAGEEYAHLVPAIDEPADHPGSPQTQERVSRAHASLFLPDGRIATTDLGFDLVRIWRRGTDGLRADHEVVLPAGSGPRHLVWHPSGHVYVVTEFSREVFVLAADETGRWRLVAGAAASAASLPDDTGAEITLSRDGEYVYAGLRGSNTIAVLRVRGGGESLAPVALVDAGVDWPRHHLVVRDTLLVAGQRSNDVVSMSLDIRTGVPGRVRHRTAAPSPTRLLPARP
ncbi:beta-propeller fold lactonase family protein [Microbacterium limosum]|uniref:Beta-propeller fold lactonase family protein n=1 Tax=Microbacterium limosum TaxID=3079935 RepID=A0AAU0MHS5_9MICO|nr:beta-propeller fold lactonase family protein [Microbacterium sp. Y20]WOQ69714.1 beta-propeller fold lactonase family protein [Microbacterium sp. Y20]